MYSTCVLVQATESDIHYTKRLHLIREGDNVVPHKHCEACHPNILFLNTVSTSSLGHAKFDTPLSMCCDRKCISSWYGLQIGASECARGSVILIDDLDSRHRESCEQVEQGIYTVFVDSRRTSSQRRELDPRGFAG